MTNETEKNNKSTKPIKFISQGIEVYRYTDIELSFGEDDSKRKEWREWFAGQTGLLSEDGTHLVYAWDYERFMEGKRGTLFWD